MKAMKCPDDCGAKIVWATTPWGRLPFEPEDVAVTAGVWVLRKSTRVMVPCSTLDEETMSAMQQHGLKGWRKHACPEWLGRNTQTLADAGRDWERQERARVARRGTQRRR